MAEDQKILSAHPRVSEPSLAAMRDYYAAWEANWIEQLHRNVASAGNEKAGALQGSGSISREGPEKLANSRLDPVTMSQPDLAVKVIATAIAREMPGSFEAGNVFPPYQPNARALAMARAIFAALLSSGLSLADATKKDPS